MLPFKEDLLHFIWKSKFLLSKKLFTTDNQAIEVVAVGVSNPHDGPDFFDARIRVGNQLWAGNVEIHVNATDWVRHGHQNSEKYKNVILHLVYNNDLKSDLPANLRAVPVLELKHYLNSYLIDRYQFLMSSKNTIPCTPYFKDVYEPHSFKIWLSSILIERVQQKTLIIESLLKEFNGDFHQTLFTLLFQSFGYKGNEDAMLTLSKRIDYRLFYKYSNNLHKLESLIFAVSGLLPKNTQDPKIKQWIEEGNHLLNMHKIEAMTSNYWNFKNLRPQNFPGLRLAQLAAFLFSKENIISSCMQQAQKDVENLFAHISPSEFWNNHYNFDKASMPKSKKIGKALVHRIIINVIVPFRFMYHKAKGDDEKALQSIDILDFLKAEENNITKKWLNLGINIKDAAESQALIQLFNNYCNKKRCLNCKIGNEILIK